MLKCPDAVLKPQDLLNFAKSQACPKNSLFRKNTHLHFSQLNELYLDQKLIYFFDLYIFFDYFVIG